MFLKIIRMETYRISLISNVIQKLEKIQSNSTLKGSVFRTLIIEKKTLKNDKNEAFINNVCNYLLSEFTYSNILKEQLHNLLMDKNNSELVEFCYKFFNFTLVFD